MPSPAVLKMRQDAKKKGSVIARPLWFLALAFAAAGARSESNVPADRQAHFQATYIYQSKPAFASPYSGPRSLNADRERSYTLTATALLGTRAWRGAELYFDAEAIKGQPLSNVTGLGGLSNGELQKVVEPQIKVYVPRLFLRQTLALGADAEPVESDNNQLAGPVPSERLVLSAGKLSITDIFTRSSYLGDPRTQFLNWSFLTYGAFDYAADLRGYSWGAALEYYRGPWALRAARFEQPKTPNSMTLDHRLFSTYGDEIELEHRHRLGEHQGKLQLLAFRNRATMASYAEALSQAAASGSVPDITTARDRSRVKGGFGVSAEQALGPDVGVFARVAAHDGKTETYAFTDIDRAFTAGGVIKGTRWARADDTVGVGFSRNGISASHRDYLAAGGITVFLGDGRLNYRAEQIYETYYSIGVAKQLSMALDWQHIRNPGYNADRGPVQIYSLRLHAQF
jgi:high affinity Mn2+ porin